MEILKDKGIDFHKLKDSKSWNKTNEAELKMHKIHVYPAKFPSFLISRSLKYAKTKKIKIQTIGDIFCGCGTTALEAKRNNLDFWGCDINPVATLITKVKTQKYVEKKLVKYYTLILNKYELSNYSVPLKLKNHERLNYWFEGVQIEKLYRLRRVIKYYIPKGKYQDFFLVAFSNILKGSSKWLTKSIKPTLDKTKKLKSIEWLFKIQFGQMLRAVKEYNLNVQTQSNATILTKNFLDIKEAKPFLDLLITSPPYVTSYEYADLHQLSTLWLEYTTDFKTLRKGTIGSVFHQILPDEIIDSELNSTGREIYNDLIGAKRFKTKSVAKYFIDIKKAVSNSYTLVKPGGLAIFVIGNTKHKNVYVDNAKYIATCMFETGFKKIDVFKRRISSKILSPYRNKNGKFSNDKRKRKVYSYEFVLIAKK